MVWLEVYVCDNVTENKCKVFLESGYVVNDVFVVQAVCFFFNDTATTEIYTLSLHDALPI